MDANTVSEMKDPSRIPKVIAQLQRTWEGQPDLTLTTLFGILNNRGLGWGSDDSDLMAELQKISAVNPEQLTGRSTNSTVTQLPPLISRYLIDVVSPPQLVTVDPYRISVRSYGSTPAENSIQPGVFGFDHIAAARVGAPLRITDAEGFRHRFGVIRRITRVEEAPQPEVGALTGLTRNELGNRVFWVSFANGDTALIDRKISVFHKDRRTSTSVEFSWIEIRSGHIAELLVISDNGEMKTIGTSEITTIVALGQDL